jgi:hypothetical protein
LVRPPTFETTLPVDPLDVPPVPEGLAVVPPVPVAFPEVEPVFPEKF